MSDKHIQASFNTGEWAPTLNARVDLQKYRSGAALLENFFVDYRGGASTRVGTKYILQAYKSATAVRLIPFQAAFNVGYVLEFGDEYIRFYFDGAPVLEGAKSITSAASGPPEVFTSASHGYLNGEWIFVANKYYIVQNVTTNTFTLTDLFGNAINTNPFTLPVNSYRIYTIASPYAAADLRLIKFAQNVNQMILCHPDYEPYILTLIDADNWTLLPITFGTTAVTPTGITLSTTMSSGGTYYAYVVTAVDANGQESSPSAPVRLNGYQDMRSVAGSIGVSIPSSAGAVSYNIYRAVINITFSVKDGATYGFVGSMQNVTDPVQFIDTNIAADFSQTPPIAKNPFQGEGIASVTVTAIGIYTSVPTVSFTGASSQIAATAVANLSVQLTPTVGSGGSGYASGDLITFTNGVVLIVDTVSGGAVTAFKTMTTPGAAGGNVSSGSVPSNPVVQLSTTGGGSGCTANLQWSVNVIQILNAGAGYTSTPTVTISAGSPTATATATLEPVSNGYPSVPGFFQQRLVLAAPNGAPQTFYMSQPGAYFNFNINDPVLPDNAITATLVSGQLNTIKAMVSQTTGLLMLTDRASWLVNGGSNGSAVTPSAIVANAQSFNGVSDVPPIVANFDVLYVQSKGSIIRDSAYNIYANVFTGTDISVLSSHLFYGYEVLEWAWAEEPFKVVWAIRNDGVILTLTFLKEQEFIGWAHSVTQGSFKSIATVVEAVSTGTVDAVYTVVERVVEGQTLKYIERFAERQFPNGVADAWTVDAGLQYVGTPATNFSGGEHLAGLTVTGLADGQIITPFVMPVNGAFTLPVAASKVTVGIGFTCDLQTLAIDLGEPTVQGKVKKIVSVDVRVADTLGLKIGSDFDHLTPMKDLVRGNVSRMLTGQQNQIITDLTTGDAETFIDPTYTVPGQYCIRQSDPYPATILGVIPSITLGDGGQRG